MHQSLAVFQSFERRGYDMLVQGELGTRNDRAQIQLENSKYLNVNECMEIEKLTH